MEKYDEHEAAINLLQTSIKIFQSNEKLSKKNRIAVLAALQNNLGLIKHKIGNHDSALTRFRQALAEYTEIKGSDHRLTATAHDNVAIASIENNIFDDAPKEYHQANGIFERIIISLEPHDKMFYIICKDYCSVQNNIGLLLQQNGCDDDALNYFHNAIKSNESNSLKHEHPDTAATLSNIGISYQVKGDLDTALEYFHKACTI